MAVSQLHQLSPGTKHVLHCISLFTMIVVFELQLLYSRTPDSEPQFDPFEQYGYVWCTLLYLFRMCACLTLPQALFNFFGMTLYNAFVTTVSVKGSPLLAPFVCVRVVTRGDFADLVKRNVQRNMKTLLDVGLEHFIIEVATDKPLGLPPNNRIREIVIPSDYVTKTGALFKVRRFEKILIQCIMILIVSSLAHGTGTSIAILLGRWSEHFE
jgi:egghead protein (zeste-white 4 protein)